MSKGHMHAPNTFIPLIIQGDKCHHLDIEICMGRKGLRSWQRSYGEFGLSRTRKRLAKCEN